MANNPSLYREMFGKSDDRPIDTQKIEWISPEDKSVEDILMQLGEKRVRRDVFSPEQISPPQNQSGVDQ